jgi:glycosyltransferase involved in cell wall biosynthesis
MTISFCWINGTKPRESGQWNDGLAMAMKIIEKEHDVTYHDQYSTTWEDSDVILFWEAVCTAVSEHADFYNAIRRSSKPKILLFAGGPIELLNAVGFDLYLVESEINEREFEALGLPWMRAFGINSTAMKPERQPKIFDGMFQSTCASWKRLDLFSQALGSKGVVCGRYQENDRMPFEHCRNNGTLLLSELKQEAVASLLNATYVHVNTSEFWGGGQRSLLESLSCGIPAIAMSDSPKNSEYILESGAGLVVEPNPQAIREGIEKIKADYNYYASKARPYIESKWTEQIYAQNILKAISSI